MDFHLISAFNGLETDAQKVIKDFSKPFGFDITKVEK